MTYVAILLSVFFTSLVSGLVGMAGGALLMAILVNILPVPSAMILHAITQLSSNSFRAFILREHLRPSFLFHYIIGADSSFWFATDARLGTRCCNRSTSRRVLSMGRFLCETTYSSERTPSTNGNMVRRGRHQRQSVRGCWRASS